MFQSSNQRDRFLICSFKKRIFFAQWFSVRSAGAGKLYVWDFPQPGSSTAVEAPYSLHPCLHRGLEILHHSNHGQGPWHGHGKCRVLIIVLSSYRWEMHDLGCCCGSSTRSVPLPSDLGVHGRTRPLPLVLSTAVKAVDLHVDSLRERHV